MSIDSNSVDLKVPPPSPHAVENNERQREKGAKAQLSSSRSNSIGNGQPLTQSLEQKKNAMTATVDEEVIAESDSKKKQSDSDEEQEKSKVNADLPPSPLAQLRALFDDCPQNMVIGIGGGDGDGIERERKPIDAYLLPRTDAHNSEYISDRDLRVKFVSGFSGTNAYAVITRTEALLWTDGRYFIQAETELKDGWKLMKIQPDAVSPVDWLVQNLDAGSRVGFDPVLVEHQSAQSLLDKFDSFGLQPVPIRPNLVDLIWPDRPAEEIRKLIYLSAEECGEETAGKLAKLRAELRKHKCDSIVLGQLDDVAWLYNLRGADISFNPVFFSYAFVTEGDKAFLFVDLRKMSPEVAAHLKKNSVEIFDYNDVFGFIKEYHEACKTGLHPEKHKIWISQSTNHALGSLVGKKFCYLAQSPVQKMKVVKNEVELDGMRKSHIRDSAAMVKFLYWLKNELELGHVVDECRAAKQINYYRAQLEKYVSLSFETISAADEHAALPHYHMNKESGQKRIAKESVYLLDSGGQYRDGTTDVTRTVCFADKPDDHFMHMYTLVFKAHVDLALTKFPKAALGAQLDGITRASLWDSGYDFGHGTGHGVGFFLNVHENCHIGHRLRQEGMRKGAVVTIEPGYYAQDKFGVRIENCYELAEAKGLPSGAANFLRFVPLTLVPIQKNLLKRELLQQKHIDWLNRYHNLCLEAVGRYLQEKVMQEEYNFLAEACTPF